MIRLFTALELPFTVRDRLGALQRGIPGARWTDEEQMHLTLRFIGEVQENVADDIDLALENLGGQSFELSLRGVGYFGGAEPRLLYAGVDPNPALDRLVKKIEVALQRLGLKPETRKFTPHVTLARLKMPPPDKLAAYVLTNNLFATEAFWIESFTLFSSHLSDGGSHYTAERTYPLRPAAP